MTQTLTQHVTAQLRAEMGRKDLTRAQLARLLAVSEVWIGRRLNGVVPITLDDLDRLAAGLDVTPESLLAGASAPAS